MGPGRTISLATYLQRESLTPTAFARLIDKPHSSVLRYLAGTAYPRRGTMQRIRDVTGGLVTADSLYVHASSVSEKKSQKLGRATRKLKRAPRTQAPKKRAAR